MQKMILSLLCVMLFLSGTALAAENNYKPEEVLSLRSFMETADSEGVVNGQKVKANYNADDPTTYGGIIWQDSDGDGVYQVRDILITGKDLTGILDVSGFTQLNSLSCSGTLAGKKETILEVKLNQCSNLRAVNISNTSITSLELEGLPKLRAAVFNKNQLKRLKIKDSESLAALSVVENAFTQETLPTFNYKSERQYQPQNILGMPRDNGEWMVGSTGCLSGLGASGARFTLITEDGKEHRIANPGDADLTDYKDQKIYLKIEKEGYPVLTTNTAKVGDGNFNYPPQDGKDETIIPEETKPSGSGNQGADGGRKSPYTGILPGNVSIFLCVALLILLIGSGLVYKKIQENKIQK